MAKKPTSPLVTIKRTRSVPYANDFESLKAEILADARASGAYRAISQLPISQLRRGRHQPRSPVDDEALRELADSIRMVGIIEPIVARPIAGQSDAYEILAGDRRWRAAQKAGLDQVPVVIHDVDDRMAAAITLVENLQREDLNPIEEAIALQRLMEEFQLTQAQAGELVSKSESAISKVLGLLKLIPRVQELIRQGMLEAGHGKVLLSATPEHQLILAEQTVQKGWSVRELERQKTALLAKGRRRLCAVQTSRDPNLRDLEIQLGEWFSAPVQIRPLRKGGGRIEITFTSAAECDGILQRLGFKKKNID